MNKLAERLRYLRELNKLSQRELAKRMNVTQSTIAKWEGGTREPSLNDLIALANIFTETTDFLLGRTDD